MNCLIDFLTDGKQKSLINMVQNRDETFENELESYMRLFLVEMDYYIGRKNIAFDRNKNDTYALTITEFLNEDNVLQFDRKDFCQDENCYFADACSNVYSVLGAIDPKKIRHFFKGIQYCYKCWIDSKPTTALEALDSLLKEYELISDGTYDESDELVIKNITERVFFRGRITSQFLGKIEMFHVPYNKRYNLCNERFSLTGQPVLYLGNSIADIVEELDVNVDEEDTIKRLKISSFEFLNKGRKRKIFDLRCNIWQDMKNIKICTFSEKKLFRNILSAICSFQKRKELEGYAFKEEYVIPQMLAQVLKQNHYDGICYYSTKRFQKYSLEGITQKAIEAEQNMVYRENVAIFTQIGRSDALQFFDKELRDSLEISMPISIRNIEENTESEFYSIYQSIKENCKNNWTFKHNNGCNDKNCELCGRLNSSDKSILKKADSIVSFYTSVFSKLKVENRAYIMTDCGQIHLQLLIGILNRILVESEVKNDIESPSLEPSAPDLPAINVQCCDLFGNETKIEVSKNVHDKGCLHKAQIIFITKTMQSDSDIYIAMCSKKQNTLFYGHSADIDELLKKEGISSQRDKKKIGTFLHRSISTTEWDETDFL